MEEEDRGLIFGGVRYTIIPSDELDSEKTRSVRKRMPNACTELLSNRVVVTRESGRRRCQLCIPGRKWLHPDPYQPYSHHLNPHRFPRIQSRAEPGHRGGQTSVGAYQCDEREDDKRAAIQSRSKPVFLRCCPHICDSTRRR